MGKKKVRRKSAATERADPRRLTPAQFRRAAQPYLRRLVSHPRNATQRAANLRALYAIGGLVRRYIPERARYGDRRFLRFAEAVGRNPTWLYSVWRFAGTYDQGELDELCATGLSWGHIVLLLPRSKAQRRRFQRQAVRHAWGVGDLRRALREDAPPLRSGGRRVTVPRNPADALRRLAGEASLWARRARLVRDRIQHATARERQTLQREQENVAGVLEQLRREADDVRRALEQASG